MHKLYLIGLSGILSLFSCDSFGQAEKDKSGTDKMFITTHYNILFAPDMSNRVNMQQYKRPLNDVDILSVLTNNLYPSILRFKRLENQKDKLKVDFINKGLVNEYQVNTDKLMIDFGRFERQNDRINYILERNNVKQTLREDLNDMRTELTRINNLAFDKNFGADIWSYLNQGIDETRILAPETPIKYNGSSYQNTYRNILILLTDGYIEAGIFGKGFDLSENTVKDFRKAFSKSGETSMQDFLNKHKNLYIKPVKNPNLKNLEILVLELYDRSLSPQGSATVHPTDMEIMKLLWTNWLQQSNVKKFELHPYAISRDEVEKIILNFIGITKTK